MTFIGEGAQEIALRAYSGRAVGAVAGGEVGEAVVKQM